jgi:hypothetical protein
MRKNKLVYSVAIAIIIAMAMALYAINSELTKKHRESRLKACAVSISHSYIKADKAGITFPGGRLKPGDIFLFHKSDILYSFEWNPQLHNEKYVNLHSTDEFPVICYSGLLSNGKTIVIFGSGRVSEFRKPW